ncbi:hypothetical protein AB0O32_00225 [Streptomyces rubiginosohelvolus]|uniref:hypothetical protein n=1 Tax=Streptomyces rubiginosohelvolus TaxID=67362 RepID=UPI00343D156F
MTVIPIGRVGKIAGGEEDGRFVKIKELPDRPPSYLILLAQGPDFAEGCGDFWVKDSEDVEEFINEAGWSITWLPLGPAIDGTPDDLPSCAGLGREARADDSRE